MITVFILLQFQQVAPIYIVEFLQNAVNLMDAELEREGERGYIILRDSAIWRGWSWTMEYFNDKIIGIIPGLSSFNASNERYWSN